MIEQLRTRSKSGAASPPMVDPNGVQATIQVTSWASCGDQLTDLQSRYDRQLSRLS